MPVRRAFIFNSQEETTRENLYHNQCFNITVQWQCSFTMLSIPIRWTPYYFRFLKTKLILSGKHPSKRWHSECDSKFNLFSVIFIKVENHNRKLEFNSCCSDYIVPLDVKKERSVAVSRWTYEHRLFEFFFVFFFEWRFAGRELEPWGP